MSKASEKNEKLKVVVTIQPDELAKKALTRC
jgi:hypothetical protein